MSYASLVFNPHHSQAAAQLLDQVIFFIVERCAAELRQRERVVDRCAIWQLADEGLVARLFDELRDPFHRPIERPVFPMVRSRRAVLDGCEPIWIAEPAEGRRAFGTERPLVDGT